MFKALALPYLINIPTERALARELAEREALQVLCGFLPGKIPSRPTFWHFRNTKRYIQSYPELMLRVLIAMVLSGERPRLDLPFVTSISQTEKPPDGHYSKFDLDMYRAPIEVWTIRSEPRSEPPMVGKDWHEFRKYEDHKRQMNFHKKGLAGELGLPAEVKTELYNQQVVRFGIDKPEWLDSGARHRDTLTTAGPASVQPYATCAVLVIREHNSQRQILLSRRLVGYGKGTYTLPGGKPYPKESLQVCTERELREETTLQILKSRPVSLYNFRLPGKPRVHLVGVLAEEYEGKPQHPEPEENTEWQWYNLDKLPAPLFEPTRVAIAQYINKTYPNLQWSDVESYISKLSGEQLALPGLL
jgi:8-oxo-dGTP diphosphatase